MKILVVLAVATAAPAHAQSIAARVSGAPDGQVRMSFAARAGVCGNGRSIRTFDATDDWQWDCDPGPVHVVLTVRAREVVDVDTYVGGRWRARAAAAQDLGAVPAEEAADYLLSLAERNRGRAGRDAILGAVLADSAEVWPRLLRIARNRDQARETRKSAVFWLGQAAGEAAVEGLGDIISEPDDDTAVKESAIFALSQLRHGAGVAPLIEIARRNPDPRLRKKAIFWLGQSDDPRALALFEELLTRR
jgi:HEAT repeat protein